MMSPPTFVEYAMNNQISNELEFYLSCLHYQKLTTADSNRAKYIFRRFLKRGGDQEIYLSVSVKYRIRQNIRKKLITHSLFQDAMIELHNVLSTHLRNYELTYGVSAQLSCRD